MSVFGSDLASERALAAFGRAEGIPLHMEIGKGMLWYLRRRGLSPGHAQRAYGRLRSKEVPKTERGIREQVERAIMLTGPAIVVPNDPEAAFVLLCEEPLPRYGCTSTNPKRVHVPALRFFAESGTWWLGGKGCRNPLGAGSMLSDDMSWLPDGLTECPKCFKAAT